MTAGRAAEPKESFFRRPGKRKRLLRYRSVGDAEFPVGEGQERDGHGQPEEPVPEQCAVQPDHLRVLLRDGPVLGDAVGGLIAERVEECGEQAILEVLGEGAGGDPPHQQDDAGHVDR